MFVKLALASLLLVALVKAQQNAPMELQNTIPSQMNNGQQSGNMLPNNQMQNQQLPSNGQYQNQQLPMNGQMQNLQPMNFLQSLREIPARGLHMLESVISNVRNMIPGIGRNSSQPNGRVPMMNGQANGQANGQTNGQMPSLLSNLPEPLGSLTKPLTDTLSQGRLPDIGGLLASEMANNRYRPT